MLFDVLFALIVVLPLLATSNLVLGLEVPIPTLPSPAIRILSPPAELALVPKTIGLSTPTVDIARAS